MRKTPRTLPRSEDLLYSLVGTESCVSAFQALAISCMCREGGQSSQGRGEPHRLASKSSLGHFLRRSAKTVGHEHGG